MKTAAVALGIALALCGCGGGSSGLPSTSAVMPTPSPSPAPTATPPAGFSSTAVTAIPGGTTTTASLAIPSAGGISGSLLLPPPLQTAVTGAHVTQTLSDALPAGVPALQSIARSASTSRGARGAIVLTPRFFLTTVFDTGFTLASSIGLNVNLPGQIDPTSQIYLAAYDASQPQLGWQAGYAGPALIAGQNVLFVAPTSAFPLVANTPYTFAAYQLVSTAAAPIVLDKRFLQFPTAASDPTITATEVGYSGAFTVTAQCANGANSAGTVATIGPASGTPSKPGAPVRFTIGTKNAGSCTATVSDANGATASARINVSVTFIGIQ